MRASWWLNWVPFSSVTGGLTDMLLELLAPLFATHDRIKQTKLENTFTSSILPTRCIVCMRETCVVAKTCRWHCSMCHPLAWQGVISMLQPFLSDYIQWLINHWSTCHEEGEGFNFRLFKSGNEVHLSRRLCEEKGRRWYGLSSYDTLLIQDPGFFRGKDLMTFHRHTPPSASVRGNVIPSGGTGVCHLLKLMSLFSLNDVLPPVSLSYSAEDSSWAAEIHSTPCLKC